ncbi:MAG: hypothetical protein H7A30_04235 [Thermotogae bacterium]|nr:hypothetical protein [Thermotogota bacterium]
MKKLLIVIAIMFSVITFSENTTKDSTPIEGPMYLKIYNHLEKLYNEGNENVKQFDDENIYDYYFRDKEANKIVMFEVNKRYKTFYFTIEAKSKVIIISYFS